MRKPMSCRLCACTRLQGGVLVSGPTMPGYAGSTCPGFAAYRAALAGAKHSLGTLGQVRS